MSETHLLFIVCQQKMQQTVEKGKEIQEKWRKK